MQKQKLKTNVLSLLQILFLAGVTIAPLQASAIKIGGSRYIRHQEGECKKILTPSTDNTVAEVTQAITGAEILSGTQALTTTENPQGFDPSLEAIATKITQNPQFGAFMASYWTDVYQHHQKINAEDHGEPLKNWSKYRDLDDFKEMAFTMVINLKPNRYRENDTTFFEWLSQHRTNLLTDFQDTFALKANPQNYELLDKTAKKYVEVKERFHFNNSQMRSSIALATELSKLSENQKSQLNQYFLSNAQNLYPVWIAREKLRYLKISLTPFSEEKFFLAPVKDVNATEVRTLGSLITGVITYFVFDGSVAIGAAAASFFSFEFIHYSYKMVRGGWGYIRTKIDLMKSKGQFGQSLFYAKDKQQIKLDKETYKLRQKYLKAVEACDAAAPALIEHIPAACTYQPLPELTFDESDTLLPDVLTEESVLKFGSYLQDAFFKLMKDAQVFLNAQTYDAKKLVDKTAALKTAIKKDKLTVSQLNEILAPVFHIMNEQGENAVQMSQLIRDLHRVHDKISEALMAGNARLASMTAAAQNLTRDEKANLIRLQEQLTALGETYNQTERAIVLVSEQKAQLELLAGSAKQFKIRLAGLALTSGPTPANTHPELVQFIEGLTKK